MCEIERNYGRWGTRKETSIGYEAYKSTVTLELLSEMEFSEKKYYRLNHILLSSIGLWPYDTSRHKQIHTILSLLIFLSYLTLQFMKVILSECSLDLLLEVLAINSIFLMFLAKHISFLFITENIKQLRNRVRNNWSVLVNDQEIDIMHKYTNGGKNFTKIFATFYSYRMEHMLSINISQIRELAKSCDSTIIFCNKIVAAVDIHKRAMQFSDLLQESLGLSYLFVVVMAICTAAVSLFRMFRVITMQQEEQELIKLFYYVSVLFIYLIIGNFVGQEFINHDDQVHRMICNTKWYKAPVKIQKSLLFLLRKTTKTYKVNAAGLFCPSLEGLARTLSFMVSLLTLLCSI
ncbi:PREDICTED: uncharacterized protein LOC105571017 isoform X2 [Vollenhovia emeryi]|uniref:uncharacterized protein LOC105571017 isoform X2 n=1 Tax=Vollenhovia emeryi TaxID=411798 RepID=UPI0005F45B7C|nr:PREDICTED: uncharacterized protein LOC105571017 isoform X2 [Vollenhovia emeryi]